MIGKALLYVLGIGAGGYLGIRARSSLSCAKRRNNVSFLQGLGLAAWGTGCLLGLFPSPWLHNLYLTSCFFTYPLFLLSLHALQNSVLAYGAWKTALDSAALIATFVTMLVLHELTNDATAPMPYMFPVLGGVFLMVPAITAIVASRQAAGLRAKKRFGLLPVATVLFAGYTVLQPFLSTPLSLAGGAASLAFLLVAHRRYPERQSSQPEQPEQPEYRSLFQRLTFGKTDAIAVQLMLMLAAALLVGVPAIPFYGQIGLGMAISFGFIRVYLTSRGNRSMVNQTFLSVARLEGQFEEQLALTRKSNEQLRQVLELKQNYEQLLVASNEQSLREVSYETLQQVIEELVEAWYSTIDSLVYLRLTLESQSRIVYFAVERGVRDECVGSHRVSEQLVVHDKLDTSLTPRFVRLEALMTAENIQPKEFEQSFFQLLLVNVRGLALRCLQQHQTLELRFMESEMELARRIQSMLVPKEQLTLPGLRARAVYAPFTYVGGDYIDSIRVDERYTCFIVADVSGHGLSASLLASGIRTAVRAVLQKSWLPDEVLARLNQLLYEDLSKTRSFITMLVAVYDAEEHALLMSRAGHPPPLYLSAAKRMELPCAGGVGLGLSPDSVYKREKVPLKETGLLLLYTDGLVETGRKEEVRRIQSRLLDLARHLDKHENESVDELDCVESYIWEMTREGQRTDDLSALILQFQELAEGDQRFLSNDDYERRTTCDFV